MINSCVLVGRIANDPEMRYATSGTAVTNFRLAVNRQRKGADGQEETDFLDIVAFGKTAEFVAQFMDKGSLVGVEGRIQARSWQTQDGQPRRTVEIIANSVQALESRQEAERRRAARGVSAPSQSAAPQGAAPQGPPPPQQAGGAYPAGGYQGNAGAAEAPPVADFEEDPFGDQ